MAKAKLIWVDEGQAVQLPKPFHFNGTEVSIRREGRR